METINYKGYVIKVHLDDMGTDPREEMDCWTGKMVCFHSRYNLGDKHDYSPEGLKNELAMEVCPGIEDLMNYWNDGSGWERFQSEEKSDAMIAKAVDAVLEKYYVILPLYLYDHSGITMSTSSFPCPWDSGMVGIIFATWKKLKKEFGEDCTLERAKGTLEGEVKFYDHYLCGDVYGFVIEDPEGEEIDDGSCWGFYGDPDESGLVEDAKSSIDHKIQRIRKEMIEEEIKEQEIEHFFKNSWAY